jgi:hypothetical protein
MLPRSMTLVVPQNNTLNVTISTNLTYNSTFLRNPLSAKGNGPRLSRILNHIPGYTWLKNKIGQFAYGPTYGMTESQLKEYKILQDREHRIAVLRKEREAEFKVAKFMALIHPDFYWHKYVYAFKDGSEERKRAVFLFALVNKERYGNYYGPRPWHKVMLNEEFDKMGMSLENQNIMKEYTENRDGVKLQRRNVKTESLLQLKGTDKLMFEGVDQIVRASDISTLIARNQRPHMMTTQGRRREFRIVEHGIPIYGNFN